MKSLLKPICVSAIISMCATTVYAVQTPEDIAPVSRGAYLELNAGVNYTSFDILFGPDNYSSSSFGGFGANANLGYQFMPYFAVEAGYMRYFVDSGFNEAHLAVKGILPLDQNHFKLFLKLGPGYMFGSDGSGEAIFFGGIGFAAALTHNLDVVAQFQGDSVGLASTGVVSLGLAYHFG